MAVIVLSTHSRHFWLVASWILLLTGAAGVYVGLMILEIPLDGMVVVMGSAAVMLVLLRTRTYTSVFWLILSVMFLNVANYSFLTFSATGVPRSTAAGNLLALVRLPLVSAVAVLAVARHTGAYGRFLAKNWDVLLLCTAGSLSVFFSPDPISALIYTAWFALSMAAVLGFVFVLANSVVRKLWSEHLAWMLILGYVVLVIFGLMNVGDLQSGRSYLSPAYARSNIHAIACAIVLSGVLVLMRQRRMGLGSALLRRVPSPLLLALGVLAVVPLLLSAKRMPILAAAIALITFLISEQRLGRDVPRNSLVSAIAVVVGFGALAWLVLPMAESTMYRMTRLAEAGSADSSVAARLDILTLGMAVYSESPVFGIGLNNAAAATEDMVTATGVAGYGLHNTYLAVLVEMGLVGFALFLLVGFRSLSLMRPRRMGPLFSSNLLILGIPAVLYSVTEYSLIPGQIAFWPLWIAILLPRIMLVETAREESPNRPGIY